MTDDYAAGLFDGEGTLRISYNGNQYQLLASLGMTDRRPVDLLKEKFGGWVEERTNAGTSWRPVFIWRASSGGASRLLDAVENSLIVKREHARIAREFQDLMTRKTARDDEGKRTLYLRMKEANKRGRD